MRLVLAAVLGFGTNAQAADWSRAGGSLFAGPAAPQSITSGGPAAEPQDIVPAAPAQPLDGLVRRIAADHGLDPKLLHALIAVESGYRTDAVSPVGAVGLTQLMPATAADLGVQDRRDPEQNLAAGAAYLARQIASFGDLRLALAAFNAGPTRVARLGRVPDIVETRRYVDTVIQCYLVLAAGLSVRSSHDCRAQTAP